MEYMGLNFVYCWTKRSFEPFCVGVVQWMHTLSEFNELDNYELNNSRDKSVSLNLVEV